MGFEVEVHAKWFAANAPDPEWLEDVGRRNWRAFTSDHELPSRHRNAIIAGNVGLFVVADLKQNEGYKKWVQMFTGCWPRVKHACACAERPYVAKISRNGKLYQIRHLTQHFDTDVTAEVEAQASGFGIT